MSNYKRKRYILNKCKRSYNNILSIDSKYKQLFKIIRSYFKIVLINLHLKFSLLFFSLIQLFINWILIKLFFINSTISFSNKDLFKDKD